MADTGAKLFVKAASSTQEQGSANDANQTNVSEAAVMQKYAGGCPVVNPQTSAGGCPVVGINQGNQMPHSPNNPLPGQTKPLNTWRQQSSIPTAAAEQQDDKTWTYPSEQMFYNAMKRKGWSPSEDDMTAVVAIHNAVNERAWSEIKHWERVNGDCEACGGPRLVKFQGRPKDYSPKARLLNLLGYKLPFDRHDWVVDRCGRQVRYVIDFYNGASQPNMPTAMHLDVRPALDSPMALYERLRMQWIWASSGRWRQE